MTKSVKQTAEYFRVGQHTVLAWIASGELAAINAARTAGGKPHWRISDDALQAFELLRSAQPVDRPSRRRRRQAADVVEFY
jgi:excisionase family DNA binding protein